MKLMLILSLITLASCGGLVTAQVAKIAYDTPRQKDELQREHEDRITCLKEKRCVSYWDRTAGIWVVRKLDEPELKTLGR